MTPSTSSGPLHDPLAPPLPAASTEVKTTTCYMCACRCGIRVHLRDGEVRYIDGNPEHPLNRGVICAKGSSGIMKQHSPARLTMPLKRKPGSARGDGDFVEASWDEVYEMLTTRLGKLRATDPKKFALFTGRDQMQALTGLFARQFGTPNYAAHGGFCSVNMAAGMIYTIGGSFWEFGGPDLDRAKLFVMIGTAEDHHSNPLKIALSKFKRSGGRFISINPIRTGYSAIADEWIPIKPGTDGALLMSLIHLLLKSDRIDHDFLRDCTNALDVVGEDGLTRAAMPEEASQTSVLEHLRRRVADCTPAWASEITGIPAGRIELLARELAHAAFEQSFTLPVQWTDTNGVTHDHVVGRPVAFHAMRGLAAHSNGFHTIRALSILMTLLGTIDRPGGFRHKAPFPKAIPPNVKPPSKWGDIQPNTPLGGAPLGFPANPDELAVDPEGNPLRIDKGFSWEHPLSAHGLMHNVITNAWRGEPYKIDTLMIFMANMAWNSTMNTSQVRTMLNDRDVEGNYKIPFIVVCDAFASEMTQFADLILPDTTYLERHDAMSLLDRPISEFDGPVDSVRVPVVPPSGNTKPFQEVLIELAGRLKFPAFTNADGSRKFKGYTDFIVNFETAPGSGLGFLGGWRGADGTASIKGAPNPNQWEMYAKNNCVYHHVLPESQQYMRNWNRDYLAQAKEWGFNGSPHSSPEPIRIQLYSDVLQKFRMAAEGKWPGKQPPEHLRERVAHHFDPLPFWSPPLELAATDAKAFPLNAVTQRPMAMYHSWDSQNPWLRQIHSHNYLMVNPKTAQAQGIADGGWMWVESQWGKVRCMARYTEAVEPGTVWTWNAIGKSKGAWNLDADADESRKGFLLNHLISEELKIGEHRVSNSDPITGQAGWYDVRVRIRPAAADEAQESSPQFAAQKPLPGIGLPKRIQQYFAKKAA